MKQIEYSILWITVTVCFFVQCINGFLETSRDDDMTVSFQSNTLRMFSEKDGLRGVITPDQARFSSKRLRENRELLIPTRRTIGFQDGLIRSQPLAKRNMDMTRRDSRNKRLSENRRDIHEPNEFRLDFDNMKHSSGKYNERNSGDMFRSTRSSSTRRDDQLSRKISQREFTGRVLDNRDQKSRSRREDNRRHNSYRIPINDDNERFSKPEITNLERDNQPYSNDNFREREVLERFSSRRNSQEVGNIRINSERRSTENLTNRRAVRESDRNSAGRLTSRIEHSMSELPSRGNFERNAYIRSRSSSRSISYERDSSEESLDRADRFLISRRYVSREGRSRERQLVRSDTDRKDAKLHLRIRNDIRDQMRFRSNKLSNREESKRFRSEFEDEETNIRQNRNSRLSSSERFRNTLPSQDLPMRQETRRILHLQENRNDELRTLERFSRRSSESFERQDAAKTQTRVEYTDNRNTRLQSLERSREIRRSRDTRGVLDNMNYQANRNTRSQFLGESRKNRLSGRLFTGQNVRRALGNMELQRSRNTWLSTLERSQETKRSRNLFEKRDAWRVIRNSFSERIQDSQRSTDRQDTRKIFDDTNQIRGSRVKPERVVVNERFSRDRSIERNDRNLRNFEGRMDYHQNMGLGRVETKNTFRSQDSSNVRQAKSRIIENQPRNIIRSEHRFTERDTENISRNIRDGRVILTSTKREDIRLPVREVNKSRFQRNVRDGSKSQSLEKTVSELRMRNIRDIDRKMPLMSNDQERTNIRGSSSRLITRNVRDLEHNLLGDFESTSINRYDVSKSRKDQPSMYQVGEWIILGVVVMQMVISMSPKNGFRLPLFNNVLKEKVF